MRRAAVRPNHRIAVVMVSVVVTLAVCVGYTIADVYDVAPGLLTAQSAPTRTYSAIPTPLAAGAVAGKADRDVPIDEKKAEKLITALGESEGTGNFSVAIAAADGTIAAERNLDTEREPASTTKTLTAFAAVHTLEMSGTLDTEVYLTHADTSPTIVLQGHGDMLLGEGQNDPSHINGRAGLATLAQNTAQSLRQRGIDQVALAVDDSLFGDDNTSTALEQNNDGNAMYTPLSSMAVDGGRMRYGLTADPDAFTDYPTLSRTTASDAAQTFRSLLTQQGITVTDSSDTSGTEASARIAKVSSAPLNEVMAFMLRHSDNTLAELFARLTALKLGLGNSMDADIQAVVQVLRANDIPTDGLHLTSCSGLAAGTRLRIPTLLAVQRSLVGLDDGGAAEIEGLSVPGLTGTARNRAANDDIKGLARVKTGSLGGVRALAGNVSREHGGVLLFAVIVNDSSDELAANNAIDDFMAGLAKL
ncbi:D-alanyl-D-alanine carboxypeptidase [Bifidobacterium angulatum]|uniref:D-alanyl-D-alanine carboxypeptidase n=1 Tax=Bifidobacterium angulatum TaxID=1683 RepID=UPI002E79FC57|nr:D-alanyl-D-alanine carboxypeptidase [Bifidobacterium angulatum]MEE0332720.1 D-alanyl-D-alanine carboxypeptidase [Bifidobacterium angulatum]